MGIIKEEKKTFAKCFRFSGGRFFFFTWHFVIKKKKKKRKEKERKRTNVTITFRVLFCRENKQAEGNGGRTVGMSSAIVVPPFFFIISEYYYNKRKRERERESKSKNRMHTSVACRPRGAVVVVFIRFKGRKEEKNK